MIITVNFPIQTSLKNQGLNRIRTLTSTNTGAMPYQLSYEATIGTQRIGNRKPPQRAARHGAKRHRTEFSNIKKVSEQI